MFTPDMQIAGFDDELYDALRSSELQPPGGEHRADRLRELREPTGTGGPGFGDDQQIRGRLSRQALLRWLRIRGCGRAARHRARQETVRRGLRQCAAPFRFPGQCRGVLRAAESRRHHPRHEPGPRRPSYPRRQGQPLRQVLQRGAVRHRYRHRPHRLRPGGRSSPTSTSRR